MFDTLAAPGVDHMDMAVATLDDRGVGILQDGGVLEGDPMVPVDAVCAAEDGERGSGALLLCRLDGPVVADHGEGAILQGDGIDAAIVVGRVDELQLAPRLTVVARISDTDVAAAGATEGLQTTVGQADDAGLDGLHTLIGLDKGGASPGLTHIVGELEVDRPPVTLVARGGYQTAAHEHGLVFDRAVDTFGQRLALAPRLAAILRGDLPTFPASHVRTDLKVELEFACGGLEEHGVPTSLTLSGFVTQLITIDDCFSSRYERRSI